MTMRTLLLSVAFLFAAACGGGGGSPAPGGAPTPDPTPDETALDILQDCGWDALMAVEDYVTLFDDIVTGTLSGVMDIVVTPAPEQMLINIDLDGDMGPDATATIRFEDGVGDPASLGWTPMDLEDLQLTTGIGALPALLAPLNGITVVLETNLPGPPQISGDLKVLYSGSGPDTASATLGVSQSPCQTQVAFSGLAYAGLLTTFPTATLSMTISTGDDTLAGTIVMNGTITATATMALNGGAAVVYSINLDTGEVTLAP